jgi:hypothetical protein
MNSPSQPILVVASDLETGDIIKVFIDDLNKHKYFLVLHHGTQYGAAKVFYLNSDNPFQDHLVCMNSDFPCLPPSRTGESIVACNKVDFLGHDYLAEREIWKMGEIIKSTAAALLHHCTHKVLAFKPQERAFVIAAVSAM